MEEYSIYGRTVLEYKGLQELMQALAALSPTSRDRLHVGMARGKPLYTAAMILACGITEGRFREMVMNGSCRVCRDGDVNPVMACLTRVPCPEKDRSPSDITDVSAVASTVASTPPPGISPSALELIRAAARVPISKDDDSCVGIFLF